MKLIMLLTAILFSFSVKATETQPLKPVEKGYIDFGRVSHNGQRTQVLTLSNNTSTQLLSDISVKISGDFSMKNKCPKELQPGQSCQVKLYFWANREGGHYGRLTVRTSEKDYLYDLYGYGERDPFQNIPNPPIPNPPHP